MQRDGTDVRLGRGFWLTVAEYLSSLPEKMISHLSSKVPIKL